MIERGRTECRRLTAVLGGVDVMRADVRDLRFDPHFHEDYTFGLVTRGANRFRYGRRRLTAPAGTLCLACPGEIHTGEADAEGWTYWTVHVGSAALAELTVPDGGGGEAPDFPSGVVEDAEAASLFARFFETDPDDPPLAAQVGAVEALSRMIAVHAARRRSRGETVGSSARIARELLFDRWDENPTLADLEAATGIGARRLIGDFKAAFGLPPHAWLTRLRVCRARAMILAGVPIARAAAEAGFADQPHLTRMFRRFLGHTPGALTTGFTPRASFPVAPGA